ncbi:MAG: TetR/AcrR family transcriptional regulator [Candidatus Riflebacteria bacterium]|jgi:AcrR family transcriptional regulator|nr:TetR/AcrR family transcriptional regulator [Candidatus Riflebacteria bacterium]
MFIIYSNDGEMMRKISNENDLRIQKTKNAIKQNLKQMICEMPYEKITVKELAKRAQINRNTFYLHYDIIDDVLLELQIEYSTKYMELVKNYNFIDNQAEIIRCFFEFNENQDEFFQKITCDDRFDYIRHRMQNEVMKKTEGKTSKKYDLNQYINNIISAYNLTTLNLYRQWVSDGRKIPMEQMIKLAIILLSEGISGLKKQHNFK